jgi:hypothetical protein
MTAALPILAALGLGLVLMQQQGTPSEAKRADRFAGEVQLAQYLVLLGSSLAGSLDAFAQSLNAIKARHPVTATALNTAYYTFVSEYQKVNGQVDVSQADAVRTNIAKYFVTLGESLQKSVSIYEQQLAQMQTIGLTNTVAALSSAYTSARQEIKA